MIFYFTSIIERNDEIQRDNAILLNKFSHIQSTHGGIDNSAPKKKVESLALPYKKREMERIDKENQVCRLIILLILSLNHSCICIYIYLFTENFERYN